MSSRDPYLLVRDMLESGEKILSYTYGMTFDLFLSDSKTIDAVIRNFEIIGEAANQLPEYFKERHSEVDWHKIRGFRNRIVHDYMGIDYEIVWHIKENFLPLTMQKIKSILELK